VSNVCEWVVDLLTFLQVLIEWLLLEFSRTVIQERLLYVFPELSPHAEELGG